MDISEKLQAVKRVRAATGCLLLDAKKDVEEYMDYNPTATWEEAADSLISSHVRLLAVDAECARIREARSIEAGRVTAGYTVDELRAMPDSALSVARFEIEQLKKERDEWEKRARELESLCADRL